MRSIIIQQCCQRAAIMRVMRWTEHELDFRLGKVGLLCCRLKRLLGGLRLDRRLRCRLKHWLRCRLKHWLRCRLKHWLRCRLKHWLRCCLKH